MQPDELSDIDFLRDVYAQAAERYRPRQVRALLVTEAPPSALDRYFYFEDVKRQDSLFLEIMGVLYPDEKARYLKSGRRTELKEDLLRRFQSDGFYLITLCTVPTSLIDGPGAEDVASLIRRAEKLIDTQTPVLLIQASLFDLCYAPLQEAGFNVRSERLPFPGNGQQRVFRERFRKALENADTMNG